MELSDPRLLSGLFGVGLALCAYLFVSLKRQQCAQLRERRRLAEAQQAEIQQLRSALEQLRQELEEAEKRLEQAAWPAGGPVGGINLNTRGQVLRLFRRGEKPEQIAATLGIPQGEVELLLKVHRTVITPA